MWNIAWIKIATSVLRYLPLEQLAARLLTGALQKLLRSNQAVGRISQLRKTVTHLAELVAVVEPMLEDHAVTGEEAREMVDTLNRTRLKILQSWSKGRSAKHLEQKVL